MRALCKRDLLRVAQSLAGRSRSLSPPTACTRFAIPPSTRRLLTRISRTSLVLLCLFMNQECQNLPCHHRHLPRLLHPHRRLLALCRRRHPLLLPGHHHLHHLPLCQLRLRHRLRLHPHPCHPRIQALRRHLLPWVYSLLIARQRPARPLAHSARRTAATLSRFTQRLRMRLCWL